MKTINLIAVMSILSINAIAENGNFLAKEHPNKYCAKLKNGKLVIMHEGNSITSDVMLANSTTIQMNVTIIKKDGSKIMLKEDECIDKDGKIMKENPKEKNTK